MQFNNVIKNLVIFFLILFCTTANAVVPNQGKVPDRYIIEIERGSSASDVARQMANEHGLKVRHTYRHVLNGFSAMIPEQRLTRLANDPRVISIMQDEYVSIDKKPTCGIPGTPDCEEPPVEPPVEPPPEESSQIIPTGISRIYASNILNGVDVDIAVIDTGISQHEDLNIIGGVNCNDGSSYNDGHGHGTHVAGTIAALNNDIGVVGVAPGARLWAVRVLDDSGSGYASDVICGLDWVAAKPEIEVANMSLGGTGVDSTCDGDDIYHNAICNVVNSGVTLVVAAGNEASDSSGHVPAAYDEVITVSALADFDGAAGADGRKTCLRDKDDTFAYFSNYGDDVDIIAPGVCIESTYNNGGYATMSGTSMAAPHVAGAAALYLSMNPGTLPVDVKSVLIDTGNLDWLNSDDPDGIKESLLDVGSMLQ